VVVSRKSGPAIDGAAMKSADLPSSLSAACGLSESYAFRFANARLRRHI
jgi:hypothetical protein